VEVVGVEEEAGKALPVLVVVEVEGHQVVGKEVERMGREEDRLVEEVVVVEGEGGRLALRSHPSQPQVHQHGHTQQGAN
jgi:hypothetical protein